jgi:hypothetical protein
LTPANDPWKFTLLPDPKLTLLGLPAPVLLNAVNPCAQVAFAVAGSSAAETARPPNAIPPVAAAATIVRLSVDRLRGIL